MRIHIRGKIVAFACAALALVACGPPRQVEIDAGQLEIGPRWTALLTPPGDTAARVSLPRDSAAAQQTPLTGVRVGGSATVVPGDGIAQTRAVVSVFGVTPGAVLPWHVHLGRCGDDRGILGQPAQYAPITIAQNGQGEAMVVLPFSAPVTGDFFVSVHASPSNLQTIVACGNLAKR